MEGTLTSPVRMLPVLVKISRVWPWDPWLVSVSNADSLGEKQSSPQTHSGLGHPRRVTQSDVATAGGEESVTLSLEDRSKGQREQGDRQRRCAGFMSKLCDDALSPTVSC